MESLAIEYVDAETACHAAFNAIAGLDNLASAGSFDELLSRLNANPAYCAARDRKLAAGDAWTEYARHVVRTLPTPKMGRP